MRVSVATALGAAAAHAKILADQEEREMELLVASVIDQQVARLLSSNRRLYVVCLFPPRVLCLILTPVLLF